MRAAVLPPAAFLVLETHRPVFAIRDGRHPVGAHSQVGEKVLGDGGPAVTQTQVVLLTATFVAVTLDAKVHGGASPKGRGVGGQSLLGGSAEIGLVGVEIGVFDLAAKHL